ERLLVFLSSFLFFAIVMTSTTTHLMRFAVLPFCLPFHHCIRTFSLPFFHIHSIRLVLDSCIHLSQHLHSIPHTHYHYIFIHPHPLGIHPSIHSTPRHTNITYIYKHALVGVHSSSLYSYIITTTTSCCYLTSST
ncbi:hypothetical protein K438DRAFT_1880059, partial [Mycena galopus ATCC 62051]